MVSTITTITTIGWENNKNINNNNIIVITTVIIATILHEDNIIASRVKRP